MAASAPARAEGRAQVAVSVRVDGRTPYGMFEVVELTASTARLRSPLLLELGEQVALRLTRGERVVDVSGRVAAIDRAVAEGDEPITVDALADGAPIAPLLA